MISRLAALIFALLATASCQTFSPSTGVESQFNWSETSAHELDYKETIATVAALSPAERENLLAFMFKRYRNPANAHDEAMFASIPDSQLRNLAASTRVALVDLNGNGNVEIIAQGNGLGPCGGTGNCIVMALQSTQTGHKVLLDTHAQFSSGFEKIRLLDTSTNGYRDIVVAAHVSACERDALVLAYDREHYRQRECYHINWCTAGGTVRLSKPEIAPCSK